MVVCSMRWSNMRILIGSFKSTLQPMFGEIHKGEGSNWIIILLSAFWLRSGVVPYMFWSVLRTDTRLIESHDTHLILLGCKSIWQLAVTTSPTGTQIISNSKLLSNCWTSSGSCQLHYVIWRKVWCGYTSFKKYWTAQSPEFWRSLSHLWCRKWI
jgi:hypothetical protein